MLDKYSEAIGEMALKVLAPYGNQASAIWAKIEEDVVHDALHYMVDNDMKFLDQDSLTIIVGQVIVKHFACVPQEQEKTIKVRYLNDKVEELKYIGGKSDWIDLRAAEDVEMKKGDFKLIPLGVAMQLPAGYEAHMIPCSSTYKNFGVIQANHMGMFDESYCGDNDQWYFPAIAMRDTIIHAGERICQFRIIEHQPHLNFIKVESLGNRNRGGLGSTGTK